MSITTADGQTHTEKVDHAKGSPQNPAGEGEIRAKFDALCHMLSAERRDEIAEAIGDLENRERFADVMALLVVE